MSVVFGSDTKILIPDKKSLKKGTEIRLSNTKET